MNYFSENYINLNYINIAFPNLIDTSIIKNFTLKIINYIAFRFNFNLKDKELHIQQFSKNKGRDIISIVCMLLPYLDEFNYKRIIDLNDYFNYSNRKIDTNTTDITIYLENNFNLLKKSIDIISNKLYVNWITVFPIQINEYKELSSYFELKKWFLNETSSTGIYIGDIYNVLVNDLYLNIKPYKWLLYEILVNGKIVSFDELLHNSNFNQLLASREPFIYELLKYSLLYFENYYNISEIPNYKTFKVTSYQELEEDRKDYIDTDIDITDLKYNLKLIGEERWNNYITDIRRAFNYTWYSKVPNFVGEIVTRKNIYHFAKSIYYKSRTEWIENKKYWDELQPKEQEEIISTKLRFNKNYSNFFKITGHLKRIYINANYTQLTDTIIQEIYTLLPDIIFQNLIYKGVLSYYKPNINLNLDSKVNIKHNIQTVLSKDYTNAYYYITGNIYDINYLNKIKDNPNDNNWFYTYAMDFFSQINFFHHIINNRISFITGSTGVGKSTQSPKIILYAYRMIYYNNYVKILCSQPRVAPTVDNAKRIAVELGVPLDNVNYFIQYQHSKERYTPINYFNTFYLKIMTDGALLEILKSNLTLFTHYRELLTKKNSVDVIIVDEAHEHNKNMDLILTLIKKTMKINPTIKLYIVSATMDDDEPRYRSYYRDIPDDIQIPQLTKFNSFVDRRIHISPYGKTTRFIINEFYEKDEPKDYSESEKIGIERVISIVNKTKSGEILFFSIGEKEIKKIVKALNEQLPLDVIAVPFYSNLPENFKDIFSKLQKNLIYFHYDKKYLLDILEKEKEYWLNTNLPYDKSTVKFTRAVIIATNVAEASITISTLEYVVDTGYSKVNKFNYLTGGSSIELLKINESSRLQRKGRVGRVSNGTVHYIYAKDSRKDIITEYKITIEPVYDSLISMLTTKELSNRYFLTYQRLFDIPLASKTDFYIDIEQLLDKNYSFYIIHPNENSIIRNHLKSTFIKKDDTNPLNYIHNIITSNYLLKKMLFSDYLENLKELMKLTNVIEFNIFNYISLVLAFNINFNTFYKLCYNLFNVITLRKEINLNIIVEKVSYDKNKQMNELELKEKICKFYDIFKEHCKIHIIDNNYFYYNNPLNYAIYKGDSYYNKFSNVKLKSKNKLSLEIGYFNTSDTTISDVYRII